MQHYIDNNGFSVEVNIPNSIFDSFIELFVKPNVTEKETVDMDAVLDLIWKAERKCYGIMHSYGICSAIDNGVTMEDVLDGDEFGIFVFGLLKIFIANDFFEAEFPLFLHDTLMDYGINLYTFSD